MPILHTCIWNVFIEVERNISQLILWGSITRMSILEASYFIKFSSTLLHPVFAHEEYHVLHRWQENDGHDTVFISSHFIKWFMISVCRNIDDVHLDHLIKVVAVKILHCQVTLFLHFPPHFREVFNYYLLKYFLMVFLFIFFCDSYDSTVGAFNTVLEVSEIVLISFNSFFFFPL